ncbi:MAG: response regulator transcription factor, partial [Pseudoalteromonas sp.]
MTIHVLLVEDDKLLVKRILNHFAETEFTIENDATGAEALAMVQLRANSNDAITLAIVDIVLPKRDGLHLAKELNTLTDIGVIMLSSRDSQADRIAGLAQGADDYICKPVDLLELELRMRALHKRLIRNNNQDESKEFIEYAD